MRRPELFKTSKKHKGAQFRTVEWAGTSQIDVSLHSVSHNPISMWRIYIHGYLHLPTKINLFFISFYTDKYNSESHNFIYI